MRYLILVVALCLPGCATLIHRSDESVEVNSTPSGANVEVNDRPVGEMPTTATLERGTAHTIRIYREGYEPHEATLQNGRSLWASLNILNFGVGLLVDASTGAFYSLKPDAIGAELDSIGTRREGPQ